MQKYLYSGNGFNGCVSSISNIEQRAMYRAMLRIRRIEEEIERRYHENEMKTPIHLVIGQEAVSVGTCSALTQADQVFSGHRTHGVYLAKGGDLKAMMAEMYCRTTGCAGSRGGSMHLFDKAAGMAGSSAICGGAVPIAAGAALSVQAKNEDIVVAVYFGDGAAEEGVVWETINFAALRKLPIIFVCENNFYSVCTPLSKRQPESRLHLKARSFGVNSAEVDGMNVLKVHQAMTKAIETARTEKKPFFLEATTYRFRAHGGSGDDSHTGYRQIKELEEWLPHCPVESFRKYLEDRKVITAAWHEAALAEINKEIAEAFEFAINSPMPEEADLYTHVYA